MISFQQFRPFFLTIILTIVLTTSMTFGFENSWATTSLTKFIRQSQAHIVKMNRAEAKTKNAERSAQKTIGKITDNLIVTRWEESNMFRVKIVI